MLTAWELEDMREQFRASCDTTCIIREPGEPVYGPGGSTPGEPVETERLCRVSDLTGDERELSGSISATADVLILLEWGDPISWEATIEVYGKKYSVIRTSMPSTQQVALRVYGTGAA